MADQWCVLELMGHVRTAGRVSEEEHFGAKVGRIDIPQADGSFATQLFGGGSIYRLTYVDEAAARAVALASAQAPIHAWEMPKMLPPVKAEVVEAGESDILPEDRNLYPRW